jgi:uncharacterized membrane protein
VVLAMVVLAATRQVARSTAKSSSRAERLVEAQRLQNRLF